MDICYATDGKYFVCSSLNTALYLALVVWFYCHYNRKRLHPLRTAFRMSIHWNFVNYHLCHIQVLRSWTLTLILFCLFTFTHSGDQLHSIYIQISFSSANESRLVQWERDFFHLLLFCFLLVHMIAFGVRIPMYVCVCTNTWRVCYYRCHRWISHSNGVYCLRIPLCFTWMRFFHFVDYLCLISIIDLCTTINESISLTTKPTTTTTTPRMLSCHEICCQVKWTTHPYPSSVMIDEVGKNVRTKNTGHGNVLYESLYDCVL